MTQSVCQFERTPIAPTFRLWPEFGIDLLNKNSITTEDAGTKKIRSKKRKATKKRRERRSDYVINERRVGDVDISFDDSSRDKNANFGPKRETHVPKSPLWSLIKDLLEPQALFVQRRDGMKETKNG